jgi:hypothetical protein
MKAILITATIGAGSVITGGSAFATDAVTVSTNNTDKKVKVIVSQPRLQDISVDVTDDKGYSIYQEDIRAKTTYGKVYDLSNLDEGIYTITASGELVTTTRKIKVEGSSATEISCKTSFRPFIMLKDNYLKVQFFNQNQENIEFTVEGSGTIYHQSKPGDELVFGEMLDVSKMPAGKYFARVNVGIKSYYYSFER